MVLAQSCTLIYCIISALVLLRVESYFVDITYVESAVAKGAVCLDGSPPAYHLSPGFGSGVNNWLVQIEGTHILELLTPCDVMGGGWCNNVTTCLARKNTRLGSSKAMVKQLAFSGIFSNKQNNNPDFYNWNKVKVRYCDGSSFTGDVERVDPATNLHYRGARVFQAVMDDLLAKGMNKANNALLSGCSAGGLTSILHCDKFHALVPAGARIKCLSDAGFFINAKDITGAAHIKAFYDDVVTTHGSSKNLPSCSSPLSSPAKCFFPQYVVPQISTPLFILNAAYDSWQVKNILAPGVADPHGTWHDCKLDIKQCSNVQLTTMQGLRTEFLSALAAAAGSSTTGLFINSCYAHCQSETQETWLRSDSPVLAGTTIEKAIGDWYFDRRPFKKIDCPYPCDKTCHNRIFEDHYEA